MRKDNTSGVTGVFWHKKADKWTAQITINGKRYSLGLFEDKEDAIKARQEAEKNVKKEPRKKNIIKKNLIGQRFGMLEVIDQKRENNRTWCLCQCDCGNVKWIRSDHLTAKNKPSRSCGCESKANQFETKDLTGQKFGRLTVLGPNGERDPNNGAVIWECRCECGNLTTATVDDLRNKKSCGCLFEEMKEEIYKKFSTAFQEKYIIDHVNTSAINYPKLRANNTSGVTGVYWSKRNKRWIAQIWVKGETIPLGSYIHKEDAIKARQEAEDKYYRTFLEEHGIEVKFDKKEKRDL